MSEPRRWTPLSPAERRVLGVLIEKQKTTPENYPMSLAALVTASNQKSNRDPVTHYEADDVEETLQGLRQKGAVVRIEGMGRVEKWRHTLYEWLDLKDRPVELAVLAELLLRGPQTEGDLRARASRMAPLPDLATLHSVLERLAERDLVVTLSPSGQRRGVMVTHGLYPPEELERVRLAYARSARVETETETDEPRSPRAASQPAPTGDRVELDALRAEVEALRTEVQALTREVLALKADLGS